MLTTQDIPRWALGGTGSNQGSVTRKTAHLNLSNLRQEAAEAGREVTDLTEEDWWKHYVCNHPSARRLTEHGIVAFQARFLSTREPNSRHLVNVPLPWRELRFDFVVIKCTGECVRLHPGE